MPQWGGVRASQLGSQDFHLMATHVPKLTQVVFISGVMWGIWISTSTKLLALLVSVETELGTGTS